MSALFSLGDYVEAIEGVRVFVRCWEGGLKNGFMEIFVHNVLFE